MKRSFLKSTLLVCLGLVVTTVVFAGMRFLSPPSPPGQPLIVDYWTTGCVIEYTAPENSGGAPINAYIVEYRDTKKKEWVLVGSFESNVYRVRVGDKKEGSKGFFRVFAQNEIGLSQPSEPSPKVIFKKR